MTRDALSPSQVPGDHPTHTFPTPRTYVTVGLILFVITVGEVAASFLVTLGFQAWAQIAVLLVLSTLKGAMVLLFYMHLRFDSRWFSFLFVAGLCLGALCVIAFIYVLL